MKKKIFVYVNLYADGEHFELDYNVQTFERHEDAFNELKKDAEAVKKEFMELGFEESDIDILTDVPDKITVAVNYFSDYWEGKIVSCDLN